MKLRIVAVALALAAGGALAQDKEKGAAPAPAAPADAQAKDREARAAALDKFILDMFSAHQGNTLCMLGNVPVPVVRGIVVDQLKASGVSEGATQQQVETAVWTAFPCPFSPLRAELLRATAKDIEGVWLFPHDSQPYRFGPKSPAQPSDPAKAIACEVVGYFPGGELRTGVVVGAKSKCPFRKAADVNPARKAPRVASWAMVADGRVRVTRTDNKDYIEEWDVYLVTKAFQALNMEIKAGDLVSFQRRSANNDVNAATEFRHLQRLK
jgi:hypothetical protein